MDFLPFPLASVLAGAFVTLLGFVLLLNIFGLPANWLLLGLVALWKLIHPAAQSMDVWFWVLMVGIALAGEALEMGLQIVKHSQYKFPHAGQYTFSFRQGMRDDALKGIQEIGFSVRPAK